MANCIGFPQKKWSFHDFWNSVGCLQFPPKTKHLSLPCSIKNGTTVPPIPTAKCQDMWVNGSRPPTGKTYEIAGVGGSIGIPVLRISTILLYNTYLFAGIKKSVWKICLAVDFSSSSFAISDKLSLSFAISDKLSLRGFLSKIRLVMGLMAKITCLNWQQTEWNMLRDMFPPNKRNPSGTLTRWRNLTACLRDRHLEFWVMRWEKNNGIFGCSLRPYADPSGKPCL